MNGEAGAHSLARTRAGCWANEQGTMAVDAFSSTPPTLRLTRWTHTSQASHLNSRPSFWRQITHHSHRFGQSGQFMHHKTVQCTNLSLSQIPNNLYKFINSRVIQSERTLDCSITLWNSMRIVCRGTEVYHSKWYSFPAKEWQDPEPRSDATLFKNKVTMDGSTVQSPAQR